MTTMTQVLAEPGKVVTVESPRPAPGPGELLVRTTYAGICGSDTHAVAGHHPLLLPPYFPGHEATGTVVEAGPGSDPALVGRRVMLKPNVPCGQCITCQEGRTNACQQLEWVGCDPSGKRPGAMAEFFVAPQANLYLVPDQVTDLQASLVECYATPAHAVRLAGELTGKRVLVQGAGTIGALQLVAARNGGAGVVVVSDVDASKRERALRLGADAVVDALSETFADDVIAALGGKADVIFDCVAMEASARQWLGVFRRGATVCIVGVPPRDFALPMPYIQDWEITVQGCANYDEGDIVRSLELGHTIPAEEIIAARLPFADAAQAFELASQNGSGKVLLGPIG